MEASITASTEDSDQKFVKNDKFINGIVTASVNLNVGGGAGFVKIISDGCNDELV